MSLKGLIITIETASETYINGSKINYYSNLRYNKQQLIQLHYYQCKYFERLLYYIEQTIPIFHESNPISYDRSMMHVKDIGVIPSDALPSPYQLFKLNDSEFIKLYLQFMLLMENDEEINKRLKMKYITELQLNQIKQQLIQQFPNNRYPNINNTYNHNSIGNDASSVSSLPYLTLPSVYNINKQQCDLWNQQAKMFINSTHLIDIYQYISDMNPQHNTKHPKNNKQTRNNL